MKMSSATKRAIDRNYFTTNADWFCDFVETEVTGIGFEEGVHRRDPSSIIEVDGVYYVYYTKSEGRHVGFQTGDPYAKVFPWDYCDLWYATSTDGKNWDEKGMIIGRGEAGSYDDRSVFTPEVLAYEGKYYLVYQVVQHPYVNRVFEHIAIAHSDSPCGPFVKSDAPIVMASMDGEWEGEEDNRFRVTKKGSFDSHKVHDPILYPLNGKFYLYYKGEPMGEQMFMGGRETKWGVAIADNILGPYTKSEYNPVTNSGHETCLWKYNGGIAAFLRTDGVEKNTMQFAQDGINFEIMSVIKGGPEACGLFRQEESFDKPLKAMEWGLCHDWKNGWGYITAFHINEEQKKKFENKEKYE
ncbi:MAG: glycosyl hydrolase [Clostridia bacterium]